MGTVDNGQKIAKKWKLIRKNLENGQHLVKMGENWEKFGKQSKTMGNYLESGKKLVKIGR